VRYAVGAAVVGAIALTGACSSAQGASEAGPSPSVSPTPAAEARALDAYRGLMAAVVEGSHEGADDHPDLAWYAKGQALSLTQDWLDGTTAKGAPGLKPKVVEKDLDGDPPTIVVEDCMDGSEWQIVDDGGEDLPDADKPRPATATVTQEQGTWQVGKLWFGEFGDCAR